MRLIRTAAGLAAVAVLALAGVFWMDRTGEQTEFTLGTPPDEVSKWVNPAPPGDEGPRFSPPTDEDGWVITGYQFDNELVNLLGFAGVAVMMLTLTGMAVRGDS